MPAPRCKNLDASGYKLSTNGPVSQVLRQYIPILLSKPITRMSMTIEEKSQCTTYIYVPTVAKRMSGAFIPCRMSSDKYNTICRVHQQSASPKVRVVSLQPGKRYVVSTQSKTPKINLSLSRSRCYYCYKPQLLLLLLRPRQAYIYRYCCCYCCYCYYCYYCQCHYCYCYCHYCNCCC